MHIPAALDTRYKHCSNCQRRVNHSEEEKMVHFDVYAIDFQLNYFF